MPKKYPKSHQNPKPRRVLNNEGDITREVKPVKKAPQPKRESGAETLRRGLDENKFI